MHQTILALYGAPLLVAAAWDLRSFRIPNFLNLIYLLMFPVAAALAPGDVDWLWHLAALGLVFVVGLALFTFGLFGGGDVKLLVVVGLWVGWDLLLEMAVWVALAGGAVAILAMVETTALGRFLLAKLGLPRLLVSEEAEPGAKPKRNIPYGLGICIGGLMMAPKLPLLGG